MADSLSLSVVVVASDGPAAVQRLLADLAAQRDAPPFEIVVVDITGQVGTAHLLPSEPGETRLLAMPNVDVSVARGAGVRAARGRLVAVTEDHCRVGANWCADLVRTHDAGHLAFGGPVEIGSFRSPSDWAAFFLEFGAFMPPVPAGRTDSLSGINAAYERALVQEAVDEALCEPIVNGRLRRQGVPLHLEPSLEIVFERRYRVGEFVRHCFASGHTFAELRLVNASGPVRVAFALAAVGALPIVLTARVAGRVFRRGRARGAFVMALPWLVVFTAAWALGEAAGALTIRQIQAHDASRVRV